MHVDQGWLSIAEAVLSPNSDLRSDESVVSLLVIHNISLPPGQFGGGHINELFSNTLNAEKHPYFAKISNLKVSAHLLIDRHGCVTQFVPFNKIAWHAGVSKFEGLANCNEYSIGIELEGTDNDPYTDIQYACLGKIARLLMSIYPEITERRIVGHSEIAPDRKTDPGSAFDWPYFKSLLVD
jgi:AmpD protein